MNLDQIPTQGSLSKHTCQARPGETLTYQVGPQRHDLGAIRVLCTVTKCHFSKKNLGSLRTNQMIYLPD